MKIVAKNRRARYDYEIVDALEAGLMLQGHEVKSCRQGGMNLAGSYVSLHQGKPTLKNATIAPYRFASNLDDYNPHRDRLLLLHKKELSKLQSILDEKGMSVIPLELRAGRHIKLFIGIGRGQKKIDKRQKLKEKDVKKRLKRGEQI